MNIVSAVQVALIIVDYFNGADNPRTQSKTGWKRCVVHNVTQLLLPRRPHNLLCTIIHKARGIPQRHVTQGTGASEAGLIPQRPMGAGVERHGDGAVWRRGRRCV